MADPPEYEPVLSAKASSILLGLSKPKRQRLFDLLYQLASQPSQLGDYAEQDATGRDIQFLLIVDYVIGFWPDHAVKEFRIVDIHLV